MRLPYPSKETLATLIGVNPSTVRRHIARMESEGLIKRIERFDSFDGLIEKIMPHAQEAIELREAQKAERTSLQRKKRAAGRKTESR